MRLLVQSDLHQDDGGTPFDPSTVDAAFDAVVVAGDAAGRLTRSVRWLADRYAGVPVVYVPGNHDFYRDGSEPGYHVEGETADAHDVAAGTDVRLLTDGETMIDGVRFVGGTLWTDLRATVLACGSTSFGLARARKGMNDYCYIHRTSTTRASRRIKPEDTIGWHRATKRFLRSATTDGNDAPTVVVTHHAPSLRSVPDPAHELAGCYASDIEDVVGSSGAVLWVHGHVHLAADYAVGGTPVLCNPRGRAREATGFRPGLVFEVPAPAPSTPAP